MFVFVFLFAMIVFFIIDVVGGFIIDLFFKKKDAKDKSLMQCFFSQREGREKEWQEDLEQAFLREQKQKEKKM